MKTLARIISSLLARSFSTRVSLNDGSYIEWFNREAILYVEPSGKKMEIPWMFQLRHAMGRALRIADVDRWDAPNEQYAVSPEKNRRFNRKLWSTAGSGRFRYKSSKHGAVIYAYADGNAITAPTGEAPWDGLNGGVNPMESQALSVVQAFNNFYRQWPISKEVSMQTSISKQKRPRLTNVMAPMMLLMTGLALPAISSASSVAQAIVVKIDVDLAFGNLALIQLSVAPTTGVPTCATDGSFSYALSFTGIANQQFYAMLLTAMTSGQTVTVVGTGTCNTLSNTEDLRAVELGG